MTDDELWGEPSAARYALRSFKYRNSARELVSVTKRTDDWKDGTCIARCVDGSWCLPHDVPDERCTCGIYGTTDLMSLSDQYGSYAGRVVTVIATEGRTLVGDPIGLRTQAARVVAYWALERKIKKACARQFVDATHYRRIDHMLKAYHLPRGDKNRYDGFSSWQRIYLRLFGTTQAALFLLCFCLYFMFSDAFDLVSFAQHHRWAMVVLEAVGTVVMALCVRGNWRRLRSRIGWF